MKYNIGGNELAAYAADPTITAMRVAQLQNYFDGEVLRDKQFICTSQQQCKESHTGSFYEGQLPHVGKYYDLTRNGDHFRVVVVGQEYGHEPNHVSLAKRREMIVDKSGAGLRFRAEGGFRARNPHMKGCTSVLRLLFGKDLGSDRAGEFIDLAGAPTHLFDCFALVNFLLCSAVEAQAISDDDESLRGKRGRSTKVMRRHCARHFQAALGILKPTVIVVQGRGVLKWMQGAFEGLSNEVVQTVKINGNATRILAFTHPAAHGDNNWGTNERTQYLLSTVEPTVRGIFCLDD